MLTSDAWYLGAWLAAFLNSAAAFGIAVFVMGTYRGLAQARHVVPMAVAYLGLSVVCVWATAVVSLPGLLAGTVAATTVGLLGLVHVARMYLARPPSSPTNAIGYRLPQHPSPHGSLADSSHR